MVAPHKRESARARASLKFRKAEKGNWKADDVGHFARNFCLPKTAKLRSCVSAGSVRALGCPAKAHLRARSHQRIADVASVGGGQQR